MSQQTLAGMKNERKIVFCLASAAFTFQFEAFVVNVALPTIADNLDITTTYVSFIVLVYLLARAPAERRGEAASLLPVALNMGTIFGVSIFETVFSMNFPVGATCWPHCHRDTINQGFSRAFLLALSIFLAAMTISFLAYPKTMEDDHGKG